MNDVPLTSRISGNVERIAGWWRPCCFVLMLAGCGVILAAEYRLFRSAAKRDITWTYPANHDQAAYLARSYEAYEDCRQSGLGAGLSRALWQPSPNGVLLHVEAAAWFSLFGPSRLAALALNCVHFGLFQVALAGTIWWVTRQVGAALFALGWLISAATSYVYIGAIMDYRLDFIAYCDFGIFVCVLVRADFGRWRGWAIVAGVVAGLLVLLRFFTFVYVCGILGVLLLLTIRRAHRARFVGLCCTAIMMLMVCGPLLCVNLGCIWHYYAFGHNVGPMRLVYRQLYGLRSVLDDLLFYPGEIWKYHTGAAFWALTILALVLMGGVNLACRLGRGAKHGLADARLDGWLAVCGLLVCFLVPLGMLILNAVKSVAVVCILMPPLIGLGLGLVVWLSGIQRPSKRAATFAWCLLGFLAVVIGLREQDRQLHKPWWSGVDKQQHEQVVRFYDAIGDYCLTSGLRAPVLSSTSTLDVMYALNAEVLYYERHGVLLRPRLQLGDAVTDIDQSDTERLLAVSDGVIFVAAAAERPYVYPFDVAMRRLRKDVREYCNQHFSAIRRACLLGNDVVFYGRHLPFTRTRADATRAREG
jgi:hypothetical protein